jgi:predicted SnoaL-like aldol condensation-catalyzing enzyme
MSGPTGMASDNKRIALERHLEVAGHFPVEFVIEEDDLVTVVHHELRTGEADYDYFGFHTYRIKDGDVVEEWSNHVAGSSTSRDVRALPGRVPAQVGVGAPSTNKRRVADFYRCVFDARDPGAVKDFVHEDYHQHSSHLPPGRAGLEALVAETFPDGPVPTPDEPSIPPAILMGEGDLVVIAADLPQPDGKGGTYLRYLYDAYRVSDGLLREHWSGVDPAHRPVMP